MYALKSVAVAFSGGVDSSFLLKVAHDMLGENAIAITVAAPFFPMRETKEAEDFCMAEHITQLRIDFDGLAIPEFRKNPPQRCYLCKKALFGKIIALAGEHGIAQVCEGSNVDDTADYRPGLQAIAELGVQSPLMACNLSKSEIRLLSRELGLASWQKPSCACLASRFPYGEKITEKKLAMVATAEDFLHGLGFAQFRVRIHGETLARIELPPADMPVLFAQREHIVAALKGFGFAYISLDLQGYRSGSMNEVIY